MRSIGLWALLGWMLISCGGTTFPTPDALFATQIPFRQLPGLRLEVVQIRKSSQGYDITLVLLNESNEHVWFRGLPYGARTFVYSEAEGKWIALPDRGHTLYHAVEVLAPKGKKGKGGSWFTNVEVPLELPLGLRPPVKVRVMVEGRIYRDGRPTEEAVGTYVDIVLQP